MESSHAHLKALKTKQNKTKQNKTLKKHGTDQKGYFRMNFSRPLGPSVLSLYPVNSQVTFTLNSWTSVTGIHRTCFYQSFLTSNWPCVCCHPKAGLLAQRGSSVTHTGDTHGEMNHMGVTSKPCFHGHPLLQFLF